MVKEYTSEKAEYAVWTCALWADSVRQEDVAPEADCRGGRAVEAVQQGLAVVRAERDTDAHGSIPDGRRSTVLPPLSVRPRSRAAPGTSQPFAPTTGDGTMR